MNQIWGEADRIPATARRSHQTNRFMNRHGHKGYFWWAVLAARDNKGILGSTLWNGPVFGYNRLSTARKGQLGQTGVSMTDLANLCLRIKELGMGHLAWFWVTTVLLPLI